MSAIVVTGRGVLTPLGDSPRRLHDALCAGRSGILPLEGIELEGLTSPRGGQVRHLEQGGYFEGANLRALDRTSRLSAAAASLALEEAGLVPELRQRRNVGLVLGTMYCSVHTISAFDRRAQTAGPAYASPLDFANTVINAAAGQTAIFHHLPGVNSTVSAGATSGLQAIAYAGDLIRRGRASTLLAGGVEELCFEWLRGFESAGLLCGSVNGAAPSPVPFGARRNGFAAAEGAALVVLEERGSAVGRGTRPLAEIRGWGSAFDPSAGGDEEQAVAAMAAAVRRALDHAGWAPEEVDCLSASANGAVLHDRIEARAVARAFGDATGELPVTAIKSMLGEALGASAAIQVIDLIETFESGRLPGIRGLAARAEDAPLPGASSGNRNGAYSTGLVTSLGFDGHSCALALARPAAPTPSGDEVLR